MWESRMLDDKLDARKQVNLFNWIVFLNSLEADPSIKRKAASEQSGNIFNKGIDLLEARDYWDIEDN